MNGWSETNATTVNVNGFSYALDNTALYADSEIVFKASNNTGTIATGGVLLRCTARENNGVDGYLINYVSASNFLQVYYLENVYNTDGSPIVLTYLGGVVYGNYGNVVDTQFHAEIIGNTLRLNTLERHEAGQAELAILDLTNGGTCDLYESGSVGFLAWNEGVSFDLSLESFVG